MASPASNTSSRPSTVRLGTVLSPGASASYPSSLFDVQNYNNGNEAGSNLSAGAIAGITVAAVAGALLIALMVTALVMRGRRNAKEGGSRNNKKKNRLSQASLLPTSNSAGGAASSDGSNGPEMAQRQNYSATGTLAVPAAVAATIPSATQQRKTGLSFGGFGGSAGKSAYKSNDGGGHQRSESTASTTPLFSQSQSSPSSPSPSSNRFSGVTMYPGRESGSFEYPRYSMDGSARPSTPPPSQQQRYSFPYQGTPIVSSTPERFSIDEAEEDRQRS